jgi:hypothetical protein
MASRQGPKQRTTSLEQAERSLQRGVCSRVTRACIVRSGALTAVFGLAVGTPCLPFTLPWLAPAPLGLGGVGVNPCLYLAMVALSGAHVNTVVLRRPLSRPGWIARVF